MNRGSLDLEAPIHESGTAPESTILEAPIHESGKLQRERVTLELDLASMRPRFMNRGSQYAAVADSFRILASMRPRFMNRGSVPDWPAKSGLTVASMRPRFMNRGSSCGLSLADG